MWQSSETLRAVSTQERCLNGCLFVTAAEWRKRGLEDWSLCWTLSSATVAVSLGWIRTHVYLVILLAKWK